jgi:hypothetical protein
MVGVFKIREQSPDVHSIIYFTLLDTHKYLLVNTSGKAGAQILHLPLGDDVSPSVDRAVSR